jgi:hypothetical protein
MRRPRIPAVDCSCDDELVRQSIDILLYPADPERTLGRPVRGEAQLCPLKWSGACQANAMRAFT